MPNSQLTKLYLVSPSSFNKIKINTNRKRYQKKPNLDYFKLWKNIQRKSQAKRQKLNKNDPKITKTLQKLLENLVVSKNNHDQTKGTFSNSNRKKLRESGTQTDWKGDNNAVRELSFMDTSDSENVDVDNTKAVDKRMEISPNLVKSRPIRRKYPHQLRKPINIMERIVEEDEDELISDDSDKEYEDISDEDETTSIERMQTTPAQSTPKRKIRKAIKRSSSSSSTMSTTPARFKLNRSLYALTPKSRKKKAPKGVASPMIVDEFDSDDPGKEYEDISDVEMTETTPARSTPTSSRTKKKALKRFASPMIDKISKLRKINASIHNLTPLRLDRKVLKEMHQAKVSGWRKAKQKALSNLKDLKNWKRI